jgi:histone acetyltransferase 1
MLILLRLDPSDARALRAYRLQVKERLYRFNFVCLYRLLFIVLFSPFWQEILVHLEKQERLDKLEETFQSVREDYTRILTMIR